MRRGGANGSGGESRDTVAAPSPPPPAGARRWTTLSGPWSPLAYVILDAVAVVAALIVCVILEKVEPRQVYMVTATLYTHSYAWHKNSVPSWAVPFYSIGAPLVAFLVWKFVERRRLVTWYDWYRTFLCLLFVLFLTGAITNCLKVAIARPRPNWFYQCWPNGTIVWQHGTQYEFGGLPQCQDPSSMAEYRKSFPSGHSSWSAAGLGFLSFWMMGQLNVFVGSGAPQMWSFLVSMVPFLAAIVVGITRITDHWHSVSDVCFGLLLGYAVALGCYLQLYPWFSQEVAYVPRWVLSEQQRMRKAELEQRDVEMPRSG